MRPVEGRRHLAASGFTSRVMPAPTEECRAIPCSLSFHFSLSLTSRTTPPETRQTRLHMFCSPAHGLLLRPICCAGLVERQAHILRPLRRGTLGVRNGSWELKFEDVHSATSQHHTHALDLSPRMPRDAVQSYTQARVCVKRAMSSSSRFGFEKLM